MSISRFAEPSLSTSRARLTKLMGTYAAATGFPVSFVGLITRGERKFALEYLERDFLHGTYDMIVSRLSALWPDENTPWPEDIPRLAPADIPDDVAELIAERKAKMSGKPIVLPSGNPWPEDIPRPDAASIPNHEGQHG